MADHKFRVKKVMMPDGERFPVLTGNDDLPIFEATVYALTILRARNLASNTIEQALLAIGVLYNFFELFQINFTIRLAQGMVMSVAETDALVHFCRLPVKDMGILAGKSSGHGEDKLLSLEKVRAKLLPSHQQYIMPSFTVKRLIYIREYISWRTTEWVSKYGVRGEGKKQRYKQVMSWQAGLPPECLYPGGRELALNAKGWRQASSRNFSVCLMLGRPFIAPSETN